ncbi:MAG: penicillin acylase family protein [Burkholderiaceae bacterium]|nr:penicillin acylase family protein [Burkholderiaceae bacterium]
MDRAPTRRPIVRRAGTLLALALLLVLAAALAWRFAALPKTSGEFVLDGLDASVRVVRDAHGIPHVFADSPRDAFRALGLLHAQDRLWQLEINRRVVHGALAEALGADALVTDRFLRTLGIRRNAQRIAECLDPSTRAALQAYADGVNAWIDHVLARPWELSPEFLLLGVRPRHWEPADSIGWATMMAWDLSGNHGLELLRLALLDRLDAGRVEELVGTTPPVPLADPARLYADDAAVHADAAPEKRLAARQALALAQEITRALPSTSLDGLGSNNWVVDGRKTPSGRPMLANDPHLALGAPSLWYLAHLSAPGLQVIGATLPGLPYVVLGRTDRLAWGFTNTAPDTQDLYLERVDPDDQHRYRTPDGWARFETRNETIRVKGAADVQLVVRETRHGPVISDVLASSRELLDARGPAPHVLSFAWTMLSPDDRTVRAGLGMNTATDWTSFREALRDLRGPQQNVVYADVEGRIAFIAAGVVPLRRDDNELRGSLPAPGWKARYDWIGTIPFDELPQVDRPADGMLVTANQRIVDDAYPYHLAGEWALPYRSDRIAAKLRALDVHDADAFAAIQADVGSPAVGELLPRLLEAQPRSERARRALALLRAWADAQPEPAAPALVADRPEPLIAVAWIDRLRRAVFEDEVGAELFVQLERHRMRHNPLREVLGASGHEYWCDDRRTVAVEGCDEMLTRSLEEVVDELSRRLGGEPESWKWGRLHPAVSTHRPFGRHWLLSKWFDLRSPSGGDPSTIDAARHDPWDPAAPFENRWAPGYRAIYDLADPDASRFILSTGQSGHRLSPRYADLVEPWSKVRYLPMATSRERIEREAFEVLVLQPAGAQ